MGDNSVRNRNDGVVDWSGRGGRINPGRTAGNDQNDFIVAGADKIDRRIRGGLPARTGVEILDHQNCRSRQRGNFSGGHYLTDNTCKSHREDRLLF